MTYETVRLDGYGPDHKFTTWSGEKTIAENQLLYQRWDTSLSTESRTKPTYLMSILGMTSRSTQWRSRIVPLVTKTVERGGYQYSRVFKSAFSAGVEDLSPWITKHRLNIADEKKLLAEFVAEAHKTAEGFEQIGKSMASIVTSVRRGDVVGAVCGVAGTRLALEYGIKPLIGDLQNLVDAGLNPPHLSWRAVSTYVKDRSPISFGSTSYGDTYYYEGSRSTSRKITTGVKLQSRSSQLDWGNPAQWAWANIPFSFLIDYAIDVGGYLQARTALDGLIVGPTVITTKRSVKGKVSFSTTNTHTYRTVSATPGYFEQVSIGRSVGSIPMPPLPEFDIKASVGRIKNTLNLLATLRCSGRKNKPRDNPDLFFRGS